MNTFPPYVNGCCEHGVLDGAWCIACYRDADTTLSDPPATVARMVTVCSYCENEATREDMCDEHAENWARTQGLMAQLRLPSKCTTPGPMFGRGDRRIVQIDVRRYPYRSQLVQWQEVETMSVDSERIVITTKSGETVVRRLADGAPEWRTVQ